MGLSNFFKKSAQNQNQFPDYIGKETSNLQSRVNALYESGKLEEAERLADQLCDENNMAHRAANEIKISPLDFDAEGRSGMELYALHTDWCLRVSASAYNYLGLKYIERKLISQAKRCYEKSVEKALRANEILQNHGSDHLLVIAYWMLANIQRQQNQVDKAIDYLEKCLACEPEVTDQRSAHVENTKKEAAALLQQLKFITRKESPLAKAKAEALAAVSNKPQARAPEPIQSQPRATTPPRGPDLMESFAKIDALIDSGETQKIEQCMNLLEKLRADKYKALIHLSVDYAKKHGQDSRAVADKSLRMLAAAYNQIGGYYFKQSQENNRPDGNIPQSEAAYRAALDTCLRAPSHASGETNHLKVKAYLGLGLTNAFRGQRDTARQYLQTCIQLPLNGQAQMDYAAESQQIAQSILK